ncbi:MAG TPA: hypothetical protein PK878_19380 [bacterium]|nr:hypothetical protein [bacterium]HOL93666.1 hypothetical protein [bacterium]HPP02890.1 hypothetical protein [bacterium]HXK93267.1 hypothetical protein [bacterium]
MSEQRKDCKQLLLLVGSNPLPNYLVSLILKPESVCLFYTPETAPVKKRLAEMLKRKLARSQPKLSLSEKCIKDAANAGEVSAAFSSFSPGAHLNYTGGTKVMAAHARMAFGVQRGTNKQASYLDERRGVLRFDDGYEIDLSQERLELTFSDILALHGIETIPEKDPPQPAPTMEDTQLIAKAVLKQPDRAKKLYKIHRSNGDRCTCSKAKENPERIRDLIECELSVPEVPGKDWNNRTFKDWCDFLGGEWLEMWCQDLIAPLTTEIHQGINCRRDSGREFEIDLALVWGYRLYVISCTTDTTLGMCKSKLFEVAMRARQLGGDLARSALVSLLDGRNAKGSYIDQLRNDAAEVWEAPNPPRAFGLDDLKEWAGIQGQPNISSLMEWLDS